MMIASSSPLRSFVAQHVGEVFFDVQRHLRRDAVQLRDQVREQVRADGVDGADFQRGGQLVLAGLGQFANALGLLQDLLRLGDDASPTGVRRTALLLRSKISTPSSSSSFSRPPTGSAG
jgi:hypothetical protein